jgi:hypothetical protein
MIQNEDDEDDEDDEENEEDEEDEEDEEEEQSIPKRGKGNARCESTYRVLRCC